jgi:hypothetical protein
MKRSWQLIALMAYAGVSTVAVAQTATLVGSTVTTTLYNPNLNTVLGGPTTATVGASSPTYPVGAIEGNTSFQINITSHQILYSPLANVTYGNGTFNGFVFIFSNAPTIVGVTLDAASTFTPAAISYTANSISLNLSGNTVNTNSAAILDVQLQASSGGQPSSYYFSDLAFAGGFQTTLTYINYSPATVTCVTNFYSDAGAPLAIPFSQGTITTRTDVLPPGGSIHDPTIASLTAAVTEGWAQASCTSPVEAGLLYRLYNSSGTPVGEASVNAETAPTTEFATFAEATVASSTGIAYANPSTTQSASITITAYNESGTSLGSKIVTLGPLQHGSANVGAAPLGFPGFTGFVKITSTIPIISLSLNAEAFPVFSSLPPGDLANGTVLVTP